MEGWMAGGGSGWRMGPDGKPKPNKKTAANRTNRNRVKTHLRNRNENAPLLLIAPYVLDLPWHVRMLLQGRGCTDSLASSDVQIPSAIRTITPDVEAIDTTDEGPRASCERQWLEGKLLERNSPMLPDASF